jgi:ABC-type antimicrobial peptide transport system permease subunit
MSGGSGSDPMHIPTCSLASRPVSFRISAVMLCAGVGLGLLLTVATGQLLSSVLYDVGAFDPIAFTLAPLMLAVAALLATWLPALRATRIEPMTALRME